MPKKTGNGGNGLESYDPETGRYIAEDKGADGLQKYHAGTHFSVSEIEQLIEDGYYGDDIKNYYANADDNKKNQIIGYFQQKLDSFWTKDKLKREKSFRNLTIPEYQAAAADCDSKTKASDRAQFHHGYKGAGDTSFEFNKALRFGIDNYLAKFGENRLRQAGLTVEEIEDRAAAFERLTNAYEAPQDMQAFRFDGTGPITSYFLSTGVFDGLPTFENQYGYTQLDPKAVDLDDLANRMQNLIGSMVPRDGAYLSFSCIPEWTHMGKNPDKIIMTKYNIPKGKKCFISNYQYESEGLLPRDTQLIVQDVKKEQVSVPDGNGGMTLVDKVVIYYGVK